MVCFKTIDLLSKTTSVYCNISIRLLFLHYNLNKLQIFFFKHQSIMDHIYTDTHESVIGQY